MLGDILRDYTLLDLTLLCMIGIPTLFLIILNWGLTDE